MSTLPSRHICIVGALAIAVGVSSIIGMIANLFGGPFIFDIGFVGIPIGYGILIGRNSSRKWATFYSGAGLLLIGGIGVWTLFNHVNGSNTLLYPESVFTLVVSLMVLACCVYVFVILTSKANLAWFVSITENTAPSKTLAWAVAATSIVLLSVHHTSEWWVKETHAQLFPLQVTVIPYDSKSGEGLNSLLYDSEAISSGNSSKPDLPNVSVSIRSSRDGMQLMFSGVAVHPVEVMITSEGFEDTSIILDQNSESEIRLAMQPLEIVTNKKE